MSESNLELLSRLEAEATPGPLYPCQRDAESPYLYGPDGMSDKGAIAMFYWPAHPNTPEDIFRAESQTYALIEFLAAMRNVAPHLLKIAFWAKTFRAEPSSNHEKKLDEALAAFDAAKIGREP